MPIKVVHNRRVPAHDVRTLRLFCLPYAAGTTRIFRGWHWDLPRYVEICPLELPGHGRRSGEEPLDDLESIMADLLPNVLRRTDKPFAILGYDYGALLGFELAHRLEHQYRLPPRHLFVAAMRAPVWPRSSNPVSEISDDQFRELLSRPGGDGNGVLELDSLMEYAVRVVRADFRVVDNYRYEYETTLSCPVTAFRGRADSGVSKESLQAWSVCTKGAFSWHEIPGGHYFIHPAKERFLHRLSMELKGYAERPALPAQRRRVAARAPR